jgi:uncharacterized protein YkwD
MRITAIIVLILLLPLPAFSTMPESSGWQGESRSVDRRIVAKVNEARMKGRKCGNKYYKAARPLVWNDMLGQATLNHSLDMAENDFLSHIGSGGSDPGERLSKAGYKWTAYGECIGKGYQTPEETVNGWLKSEMHCRNIMNPQFKEAGSAFARSGRLKIYWTLVFGSSKQ